MDKVFQQKTDIAFAHSWIESLYSACKTSLQEEKEREIDVI